MILFDIIISVILIIAFFSGVKKGLFVAAASLAGLIAGVYGAIYFSDYAASYISKWFDWGEQITNLVAFAITFSIILWLVSLAGKLLTKVVDFAMLGIFNKLLGGLFNVVAWVFILSILIMFQNSWDRTEDLLSEEKKEESRLYHPIQAVAPKVIPHILRGVEKYKDSKAQEDEDAK